MRGMVFRDALITSFDVITLHLLPVAVAQKLKSKYIFYKIDKILINKQNNAIILFKRFNLNDNIIGFCPRIRKLHQGNTSAACHILGEYFKQQFFRSFLLTVTTTTFDQFLLYSIE